MCCARTWGKCFCLLKFGVESQVFIFMSLHFFQVRSPNDFWHFNNAQHRQNQATKVKAHGTWCLPVPLPGEELQCACHLERTRARCSGLKMCGEIPLGSHGACEQSLKHQKYAAAYLMCCPCLFTNLKYIFVSVTWKSSLALCRVCQVMSRSHSRPCQLV